MEQVRSVGRRHFARIIALGLLLGIGVVAAITLPSVQLQAATDRVLLSGIADASGAQSHSANFTVPKNGPATLTLSWTGDADMRLTVFDSATNTKLGENLSASNPKALTLQLESGKAYYSTVWAASGAGTYRYVLSQDTLPPRPQLPTTRPNVVLITMDDMRADSLQYMPKLRQWLANGGTTFTNGYAASQGSSPSRATIMSGRYVHNNGQYKSQAAGLDANLTTQRYLHDAGYLTAHAGKFLQSLPLDGRAPHFDRWLYFNGGYNNVPMNFDGVLRTSSGYSTTTTFDKAVEFVNDFETRDDTKPFYLSLAPIAPNAPSIAEPQYQSAAVPPFQPDASYQEGDRADKPQWVQNINHTDTQAQATRSAMVRTLYSADDQIDRFMQHLDAAGEIDNTMVIFTSDNGYFWGEHKLTSKFLPYTQAYDIPLLIRWPGRVVAGATDDRLVTQVDIAPTILAATGVTQNAVQLDGRDILSGYSRPQAFMEYFHDADNSQGVRSWASIRTQDFQYTEHYDTNAPTTVTFREYYNLQADPYQLSNIYADNDQSNDPAFGPLSQQLQAAKRCAGNTCQ
jgi:arylsulfatase A-like enzyme